MQITIKDAGTDVAMIGAWDEVHQTQPRGKKEHLVMRLLHEDAIAGKLFLIETGGDGGGPVDLFIDEPVPYPVPYKLTDAPVLLSVPTGRLMVGGVEDYRNSSPQITDESSIAAIPPGNYALTCYFVGSLEELDAVELAEAGISEDDQAYYRRHNKRLSRSELWGCLPILVVPLVLIPLGWKVNVAISLAIIVSNYLFHAHRRSVQNRDPRFRKILRQIRAHYKTTPDARFVLHLTKIDRPSTLQGGVVNVQDAFEKRALELNEK